MRATIWAIVNEETHVEGVNCGPRWEQGLVAALTELLRGNLMKGIRKSLSNWCSLKTKAMKTSEHLLRD